VVRKLISWYRKNARELPWRETRDPFKIWLSEIILQQTRVEQGRPYYERFVQEFPDIRALADSKEEKVLRLWQGLGYYSRARNLHKAARQVRDLHGGNFPDTHPEILALPGVGDYTAAAIGSFAFGLVHPVVDGNVYRFLSRLFHVDTPIDSTAGKKEFKAIAEELILGAPPDEFNQAIMEFGATWCVPSNPDCTRCPFRTDCQALKSSAVERLPVKAKKQKVRDRYFNYLVVRDGTSVFLRQRTGKDIWRHLWEFPVIESSRALNPEKLLRLASEQLPVDHLQMKGSRHSAKHQLSHQTLHAEFYEFTVVRKTVFPEDWKRVSARRLNEYPLPRLIERYLSEER